MADTSLAFKPQNEEETLVFQEITEYQLVKLVRQLKDESRAVKGAYSVRWETFRRFYQGRHFPEMTFSVFTQWRSRRVYNYTAEIIDSITAYLLEQQPYPFAVPPDEDQQIFTDALQAVIDDVWSDNKMDSSLAIRFVNTGLVVGTSILKVYFDPLLDNGNGKIVIGWVDPFDFDMDPNCQGDLDKARWVIWEKFVPYEEMVRRYPQYEVLFRENLTIEDRRSRKEKDYGGISPFDPQGTKTFDFLLQTPVSDFKSSFVEGLNVPFQHPSKISVTECWMRDETMVLDKDNVPVQKYRNGIRLVTIVGSRVIQDGSTPYEYVNGFPFVLYTDNPNPPDPWGIGTVARIFDIQGDYNSKTNFITDLIKFAGNPVTVVGAESGIGPNDITNVPGAVVVVNEQSKFERIPPANIPAEFFASAQTAKDSMREISGVTDVMAGKKPVGTRSADQDALLAEKAVGKLQLKLLLLKKSFKDVGNLILCLAKENYTAERTVRIAHVGIEPIYAKFSSMILDGDWKIDMDTMPATASTQKALRDLAMQLRAMGTIDDQALLDIVRFPNREKIQQRIQQAKEAYEQALAQGQAKPKKK